MTLEDYNNLYLEFCEFETKPMSLVYEKLSTLTEGKDYDFDYEKEHLFCEPEYPEDTKVIIRSYKFYIDDRDKPVCMRFWYGNNTKILGVVD